MAGAVLFVVLAAEGVTILRVDSLVVAHVFIGTVLVPVVVVKTTTTTYRFFRYYTGSRDYVAKGPPPAVLRVIGPAVVVLTFAVFGTGIWLGLAGPGSHWLLQVHKLTFIAWFGVTTVHVLGHLRETPRLALADFSRSGRATAAGAPARVGLMIAALLAGVILGLATISWADAWVHSRHGG
jgi:hypothetical protein